MTTTDNNIEIATPEERGSLIHLYGHGYAKLDQAGDELAEFVQAICGELLAMRKELRTERLVVTHPEDGRELISTTVLPESISLDVHFREVGHDHLSSVAIVSVDEHEGEAYVSLSARDEIVTMLSATADSTEHRSTITGDLMLQTNTLRLLNKMPEIETLQVDTTGIGVEHANGQISAARFELQPPRR